MLITAMKSWTICRPFILGAKSLSIVSCPTFVSIFLIFACVSAVAPPSPQILWQYDENVVIALWVKPCWKMEIEEFTKFFPSGPTFMNLNYFRQNIWRLSSVQFHFWCIFGTSWTHLTAEEEFTIESVSIQAGCWKDMNEILRTSWM